MAYKAFISYSHTADANLAPALQAALERFAKPWYRMRMFRIFRDTTNLSATPELWPEIVKALAESEYLLFLASPEAAASKWVKQEQKFWRSHKDPSRLFLILTGGEIVWDDAAGDFDWNRTTAMPREMSGAFLREPLYLDFRKVRSARISMDDEQFLDGIASIAAPLHGRTKDEVFGDHIRQHRRTMRLAWSAASALAFLLVTVGLAAWIAFEQYRTATANLKIAEGRRLAAEAKSTLRSHWLQGPNHSRSEEDLTSQDPVQQSALLARESLLRHPTKEAREVLEEAFVHLPVNLGSFQIDAGATTCVLSPRGPWMATVHERRTVVVWDVENRCRWQKYDHPTDVEFIQFAPDGSQLGVVAGRQIFIWSPASDVGHRIINAAGLVTAFAFDQTENYFGAGLSDGQVLVWRRGETNPFFQRTLASKVAAISVGVRDGLEVVVAAMGQQALLWSRKSNIQDGPEWPEEPLVISHQRRVIGVSVSPDCNRVLTTTAQTEGVVFAPEEGTTWVVIPKGVRPHLWERETGKELVLESFHPANKEMIFGRIQPRFIPRLRTGATRGADDDSDYWIMGGGLFPNILFWSGSDGRLVKTLGSYSTWWPIHRSVALDAEHGLFFSAIGNRLAFANIEHNSYYRFESFPAEVDELQANSSGLLVCQSGSTISVWKGAPEITGGLGTQSWLIPDAFNAKSDSKRLQIATLNRQDHTVEVWDLSSRKKVADLPHEGTATEVIALNSERGILITQQATTNQGRVGDLSWDAIAWDIPAQRPITRLAVRNRSAGTHKESDDYLLMVGTTELSVIDLDTRKELARLPKGAASDLDFVGPFLTGRLPGELPGLTLWLTGGWRRPNWLAGDEVVRFILSQEPYLTLSQRGARSIIRDGRTGAVLAESEQWVVEVKGFSRDGAVAVGDGPDIVQVWSIPDKAIITINGTLYRDDDQQPVFAISPDRRFLVNGKVVWDLAGPRKHSTLLTQYSPAKLQFSPNGHWLLVSELDEDDDGPDEEAIELWFTGTWQKQDWFAPQIAGDARFTADSRYLLTHPRNEQNEIWDLKRRVKAGAHGSGSREITQSFKGELPAEMVQELLERAKRHLARDFTASELNQYFPGSVSNELIGRR